MILWGNIAVNGNMNLRIRDWNDNAPSPPFASDSPTINDDLLSAIVLHFSPYDSAVPLGNFFTPNQQNLLSSDQTSPIGERLRIDIERGELNTSPILQALTERYQWQLDNRTILTVLPPNGGNIIHFKQSLSGVSTQILRPDDFGTYGGNSDGIDDSAGRSLWNFMMPSNSIDIHFNNYDNTPHQVTWDAYPNRRIIFHIISNGVINVDADANDLFPENIRRTNMRIP